jgi:hypothetical protein
MNKGLYYLSVGLLCLWSGSMGFAQSKGRSHPDKLPWVNGTFPPGKGAFEYRIARGEGATLAEARSDALNVLLIDLGNKAGITVNSQTIGEVRSSLNYTSHSDDYQESTTHATTYKIDREGFHASFAKVSEYYETVNGRYHLWELYEVSSGGDFKVVIPEYTTHYGFAAAWRSVLIPGWGQMHKGSMAKGLAILAGEAVFIGGMITCETLRADYTAKINETHDVRKKQVYADHANNYEMGRNICIGAAAALYVYNLIDAVAANGRKPVLVKKHTGFRLNPVVSTEYAGLSLAFRF